MPLFPHLKNDDNNGTVLLVLDIIGLLQEPNE